MAMQSPHKLLDTPLKWVGAIAALVSVLLGLNQVTRLVAEGAERQRQVTELRAVADQQEKNADYPAAWSSLDQAMKAADQGSYLAKLVGQLDQVRLDLRVEQEDLAMTWLRDVTVPSGSTFSSVVDPLVAVATRGVVASTGPRKADLLAHVGWAYFLKSRDGATSGNPEETYRQALELDPSNPFAHAQWGHLILWRRGPFPEAAKHFAAAVAAGRERPHVRRLQLAGMRLYGSVETERGLLEAVNDMRKNDEPVDAATRRAIFNLYYSAFNSEAAVQRLVALVPPGEHLVTMRALFFEDQFDQTRAPLRDAMVALLQEATGMPEEALATWRAVQAAVAQGGDGRVATRASAAIARLSPQAPR
jgi:hypothetical protein